MCIDEITSFLEERAQKKEPGKIIRNVKNIFTSEYKSRLFISLHNNQECSVAQRIDIIRNDENSDIINFIGAIYVKIENTRILDWLRSILEVISIVASKYANIDRANLWIPKQHLPNPVHFHIKEIIG